MVVSNKLLCELLLCELNVCFSFLILEEGEREKRERERERERERTQHWHIGAVAARVVAGVISYQCSQPLGLTPFGGGVLNDLVPGVT